MELDRATMLLGFKLHFAIYRLQLMLMGFRLEKRFADMHGHIGSAKKLGTRIGRFEKAIFLLESRLELMKSPSRRLH